jgi:hypothetical protein
MKREDLSKAKILVCTANSWNSRVGDNTFPLLLEGLPKENISNLFIREETPDSPVCDNYFRISEGKVMKSIFKHSVKTGEKVVKGTEDNSQLQNEQKELYSKKARFYYLKLFIRELIWFMGKWKTKELDQFIEEASPDIVIYEMSRYIHLNSIIRYIIKKSGARGIGCFWDDTFTYKQEKSIGYKALRFFQRKNLKRLAGETKEFFAITPKTKREADEFFNISCTVLTKAITEFSEYEEPKEKETLKMLYTGNLAIGREETMLLIANALKELNKDGKKITLDVYTNTALGDKYKNGLNTEFSRLYDAIPQSEAIEKQKEADILLFVEALKDDNKIARLSFSTKITDYYAAGKCIFAVGNKDLAPVELFIEEDSAVVVTSADELQEKISQLINMETLKKYSARAYEAGKRSYSAEVVKEKFFTVLNGILEK